MALVGTAGHRCVHCWAQVGGTGGWHCWAPIIRALVGKVLPRISSCQRRDRHQSSGH
ncbi:unnamed protein product [Staurois parvus]|uniref:Uncharacterized protein n=1 Tax=Staurois parvus TaxID=386267 RepID=A0ABN9GHL9_9NEOB|nr:unnamed protein product [Staurois parvus]